MISECFRLTEYQGSPKLRTIMSGAYLPSESRNNENQSNSSLTWNSLFCRNSFKLDSQSRTKANRQMGRVRESCHAQISRTRRWDLHPNDRTTEVSEPAHNDHLKISTESGMSIEEGQPEGIQNRNRSLDGESNVTDCNALHPTKQWLRMISTEPGTQIDWSGHPAKARSPICESFDRDSKATVSSDVQPSKLSSPRISTDDGTQIDFSDEQ
jgi:hypothetical protein